MTKKAREVLEDCRGALAELSNGVSGPLWRRRYVTAVVLLRVVGHVLHKVDAADPRFTGAIKNHFDALRKTRPEPLIFWEFIERSRNQILKEYELSAGQGVTIFAPAAVAFAAGLPAQIAGNKRSTTASDGWAIVAEEPTRQVQVAKATVEYAYPIHAGAFAGRDQRSVIAEAIDWWEAELIEIEQASTRSANSR